MKLDPFIEAEKTAGHSVHSACRLLEVSKSAYYQRRNGAPSQRAATDAELLEQIRVACYERDYQVFGRILSIQANGQTYNGATVHGTTVHTEPRRIKADPRNYAVYQMDVGFTWVEVNLVVPGA